jgi:hypothetical protein
MRDFDEIGCGDVVISDSGLGFVSHLSCYYLSLSTST